jgi:hypothetical protein
VQLLSIQGNDAAITGIKAGDVVVLDGKQNLRPGTPVMDKGKEAKVAGSKP